MYLSHNFSVCHNNIIEIVDQSMNLKLLKHFKTTTPRTLMNERNKRW